MNLYISNLSQSTSNESLKDTFSGYGQVDAAKVIMDRFTGKSKVYAFIEMPDNGEANKAITGLNNKMLDGNAISVIEARPREERPTSGTNFRNDSSQYNKRHW